MTVHRSVLLEEVLNYLLPVIEEHRNYFIFDGTVGGAGHAQALLASDERIVLIGVDRDLSAVERAREKLKVFAGRFILMHQNFAELDLISAEARRLLMLQPNLAQALGDRPLLFDGMLADLGLSSDQLDDPLRGFSFLKDGPLDMRMDNSSGITAAQIINDYPFAALRRVFQEGGVGGGSTELAREICRKRPLASSAELATLCMTVLGVGQKKGNRKKIASGGRRHHPATVPFQAIRIAVNRELKNLTCFLDRAVNQLAPGGRLAVISFHSLEDQICAGRMRSWSRVASRFRHLPESRAVAAQGEMLTKKAVMSSEGEQRGNPRSRSALLRVFEKVREN